MATRNSKKKRTKRGMAIAVLGAIVLSLTLLFVVFYATDEFTMYWFLLKNQDVFQTVAEVRTSLGMVALVVAAITLALTVLVVADTRALT